jgi:hypothetical protein
MSTITRHNRAERSEQAAGKPKGHVTDGALDGFKLISVAVSERRTGRGRGVTFPANMRSIVKAAASHGSARSRTRVGRMHP